MMLSAERAADYSDADARLQMRDDGSTRHQGLGPQQQALLLLFPTLFSSSRLKCTFSQRG